MFLSLGIEGAQLVVQDAPAAAIASAKLVIIELRIISGRQLGAAIQEVGEGSGYMTRLGRCGIFVLWIIGRSIQVPQRTG